MNREELISYLGEILEGRISEAQEMVKTAQEAANNETKSTAGDKHDTARELMQQEKNKAAQNLGNLIKFRRVIHQLKNPVSKDKIQFGSLFLTNQGYVFIGLPLGNIVYQENKVICISAVSPLAKAFISKTVGEDVHFASVQYSINKIVA